MSEATSDEREDTDSQVMVMLGIDVAISPILRNGQRPWAGPPSWVRSNARRSPVATSRCGELPFVHNFSGEASTGHTPQFQPLLYEPENDYHSWAGNINNLVRVSQPWRDAARAAFYWEREKL